MSTYIPDLSEFHRVQSLEAPVMIMHGKQDPVVPYALGEEALKSVSSINKKVEFKTYNMEHQVCFEQINDISKWFKLKAMHKLRRSSCCIIYFAKLIIRIL